jgi:hypothetical protein
MHEMQLWNPQKSVGAQCVFAGPFCDGAGGALPYAVVRQFVETDSARRGPAMPDDSSIGNAAPTIPRYRSGA